MTQVCVTDDETWVPEGSFVDLVGLTGGVTTKSEVRCVTPLARRTGRPIQAILRRPLLESYSETLFGNNPETMLDRSGLISGTEGWWICFNSWLYLELSVLLLWRRFAASILALIVAQAARIVVDRAGLRRMCDWLTCLVSA